MNINRKFEEQYKILYAGQDSIILNCIDHYLNYVSAETIKKTLFGVTPPDNMGVLTPNYSNSKQPFKLNARLDWLTCSFSDLDLRKFFKNIGCSDIDYKSFFHESKRFRSKFYDNNFHFLTSGSISTGLLQKNATRTTRFELTGKSMQEFREKYKLSDLEIIKKINYTEGNDIVNTTSKITRVDLTLDYESLNIFSGLRLWDDILVYLRKRSFSSCVSHNSIKFISSGGDFGHIQTIYLGSISSDRFLCIYLKHEEIADRENKFIDNFVIRFELRISENHAYSFKKNSEQCKNDQDFFQLIRSLINDFIEFKDIEKGKNLDVDHRFRLDTAEFWSEVFKTEIVIESYSVYKHDDIYRKREYLLKNALLYYMVVETDPDFKDKMKERGLEKFIEKEEKNIETLLKYRDQFKRKGE